VQNKVDIGCNDRLVAYSAAAANDSTLSLFALYPTEQSWADGDRTVACVATDQTKKRTGSLKQ